MLDNIPRNKKRENIMVICNLLVPVNQSDEISQYKNKWYINMVNDITHLHTDVPTFIYTYELAKSTFSNQEINPTSDWKINDYYYWGDSIEKVDSFIELCMKKWFNYTDVGIDLVFDEFDVDYFISNLSRWPILHNGKYELYFVEKRRENIIIHSIQKSNLKYSNINPEDLFLTVLNKLKGECLVLSSDDVLLNNIQFEPIIIEDLIQSFLGELIRVNDVVNMFKPRYLTNGEVLVFYMKKIAGIREKFDYIHHYIQS